MNIMELVPIQEVEETLEAWKKKKKQEEDKKKKKKENDE
jgi:hypothetical protein